MLWILQTLSLKCNFAHIKGIIVYTNKRIEGRTKDVIGKTQLNFRKGRGAVGGDEVIFE